jgi:acetyltransferase
MQRPSLYARLAVPGSPTVDHIRSKRIDALRAVAALSVLVAHSTHLAGPGPATGASRLASRMATGVWLFFAISGFLIAGPFLRTVVEGRSLPSFTRYAVRRAARILPAYWVGLAAVLILATGATIAHWWQLPVHILLLQTFPPDESQKLYFVAWTLGLEAIFYALVPLAAFVAWRATRGRGMDPSRAMTVVVGVWLFAFGAQALLSLAFPTAGSETGVWKTVRSMGAMGNFCPGMLVFLAARETTGRWHRAYKAIGRQPLVSIAAAGVLIYIAQEIPWRKDAFAAAWTHPLTGIGSGLILAAVLEGAWLRRLVEVLAPVGLISYGVYLWHWVVVATFEHHRWTVIADKGSTATFGNGLVLLGLTLPLALASWLVVERPLLARTMGWERARTVAE